MTPLEANSTFNEMTGQDVMDALPPRKDLHTRQAGTGCWRISSSNIWDRPSTCCAFSNGELHVHDLCELEPTAETVGNGVEGSPEADET